MITKYRSERSINGYKVNVLKSGLQKYIRRGNVVKALYCMKELNLFGSIKEGKRIQTNMINRLMVILLEDICNISLIKEMKETIIKIIENRQEKDMNKLVRKMCSSRKARICSHLSSVFRIENKKLLELNNVKLDIEVKNDEIEYNKKMFEEELRKKSLLCIKHAFRIHNSKEKLKKPYKRSRKSTYHIFRVLEKYINCDLYIYLFKKSIGNIKEG